MNNSLSKKTTGYYLLSFFCFIHSTVFAATTYQIFVVNEISKESGRNHMHAEISGKKIQESHRETWKNSKGNYCVYLSYDVKNIEDFNFVTYEKKPEYIGGKIFEKLSEKIYGPSTVKKDKNSKSCHPKKKAKNLNGNWILIDTCSDAAIIIVQKDSLASQCYNKFSNKIGNPNGIETQHEFSTTLTQEIESCITNKQVDNNEQTKQFGKLVIDGVMGQLGLNPTNVNRLSKQLDGVRHEGKEIETKNSTDAPNDSSNVISK